MAIFTASHYNIPDDAAVKTDYIYAVPVASKYLGTYPDTGTHTS